MRLICSVKKSNILFGIPQQAPKFHTLAWAIYHYRNFNLAVKIKIVQNNLKTTKKEHYVFGPVFSYLTRFKVILKSNSCKGCFNQVTFIISEISVKARLQLKYLSSAITYSELTRCSTYLWGCWWVNKTWSLTSIQFFVKWLFCV